MELLDEKMHLWIDSARFVKPKPGIYVLYDKSNEPIFIGSTDNLQKEFSDFLDTNFNNDSCKKNTHSYQRRFSDNPNEEKQLLLEQYSEKMGRLPNCNSDS
jgi:excinuclease UvrABC nuclease subunit